MPEHEAALAGEFGDLDSITGANRAIAPDPQVVAVGEAARHDHGVDALQVAVGVPQDHGLADARCAACSASTSSHEPGKRTTPNFTFRPPARRRSTIS